MLCSQCPRACSIERTDLAVGYCGAPETFRVARIALHFGEEPCFCGTGGSGAVFFSGCNLRCVFCQNQEVSHRSLGYPISEGELEAAIFSLCEQGAENLNLVTPTPYALQLIPLLQRIKSKIRIPIVYNCGGYESVETLRRLQGLVDVYLPDFKYASRERAKIYSGAEDYPQVAIRALEEMLRQVGPAVVRGDGMLQSGVMVRHLVLPGGRKDSVAVLQLLSEHFGTETYLLSLMNQYTPKFAEKCAYTELHRRVTTFEYDSVCREALRLGFDGFFQSRSSVGAEFTPLFDGTPFDRSTEF